MSKHFTRLKKNNNSASVVEATNIPQTYRFEPLFDEVTLLMDHTKAVVEVEEPAVEVVEENPTVYFTSVDEEESTVTKKRRGLFRRR